MKRLIAATLLVSGIAMAKEDAFKSLDTDKDGSITSEEAAADAKLIAQFDSLDKKPKDGKLGKDEFKVYFHANNSRRYRTKSDH